ncbi:pyridoxal 5'-phosphate synthase glutaminase subunit PdxT [Candidatus Peregrinibacteria bacterium]|nr:pyridoxal 5'-phosphate synthase glutaminase subunit PdxT [Candidatus Peregrinibacteria bacterium]
MLAGILAFQGDVAEHAAVLRTLHVPFQEVRTLADLAPVTHLIIPGGESTVMGRFLILSGIGKEMTKRVKQGALSIFGTCAGAILLARKVKGKNAPASYALIDMTVERNSYGTQAQSFSANIAVKGIAKPISMAFIRAPKILWTGRGVEVMASHKGNPVIVRQGNIWASTCHPEVNGNVELHALWLRQAGMPAPHLK